MAPEDEPGFGADSSAVNSVRTAESSSSSSSFGAIDDDLFALFQSPGHLGKLAVTCPSLTSRRSRPSSCTTKQNSWPFSTTNRLGRDRQHVIEPGHCDFDLGAHSGPEPAGNILQLDNTLEIMNVSAPVR